MLLLAIAATTPLAAADKDLIFLDDFDSGLCLWSVAVPELSGCDVPCDPLDPEPVCGANMRCSPQSTTAPICSGPTGVGEQGQTCSSGSDCASTYLCAPISFVPQCLLWCTPPGAGDCPALTTCVALAPPVYIGAEEWGLCAPDSMLSSS
jgi:hypothetical protein